MTEQTPTPLSPPQHRTPRRSRRLIAVAGIAACAVGLTGVGYATQTGATASTTAVQQPSAIQERPQGYGSFDPFGSSGPSGRYPQDTTGGTTTTDATDATAAQELGLVYITSTLDYGTGKGAGTGMVLTSDGEVLTNHHVVEGATSISVEVVSTGQTYDAEVVGYDDVHDVAVLQLVDASGLTTVTPDTAEDVSVGDSVTGVGNANGDGGAASAAAGSVVAVDQSITVSSETGGAAEQLSGLIQVDADIIPGDSGGALYDSDGEVIGMNTAASSGTANITGYAIPIAQALSIADQIEAGDESGTVEIGSHGYLGVQLSSEVTGAYVAGVVDDSPAAAAGLTTGSTITSLNGSSVTSGDQLVEAVGDLDVGARVTVAWTDDTGQAHSSTVTLGNGPVG